MTGLFIGVIIFFAILIIVINLDKQANDNPENHKSDEYYGCGENSAYQNSNTELDSNTADSITQTDTPLDVLIKSVVIEDTAVSNTSNDSDFEKNTVNIKQPSNTNKLVILTDEYNSLSKIHFIKRNNLLKKIYDATASISSSFDDFVKKFPLDNLNRFTAVGICLSYGLDVNPTIIKWYELEVQKRNTDMTVSAINNVSSSVDNQTKAIENQTHRQHLDHMDFY